MCEKTHTARTHARTFVLALAIAGAVVVSAGPARADAPLPVQIHDGLHEHVRDVLRHLGRIPDRIHDHHARHLEVFSGGREYYRPHHHQHAIYQFPVWIDGAVAYRPYTYCNGHLFHGVSHRPQLWTDWGHRGHGSWCGRHRGYFPSQHGCFHQARYERRYVGHHDCRGGWDDCDRHKNKHKHGRGHGHHKHGD